MISEGSCDTEDWSNDVENTKINYILLYVTVEIDFSWVSQRGSHMNRVPLASLEPGSPAWEADALTRRLQPLASVASASLDIRGVRPPLYILK